MTNDEVPYDERVTNDEVPKHDLYEAFAICASSFLRYLGVSSLVIHYTKLGD